MDRDRKSPFIENKKFMQKKQEYTNMREKITKDSLQKCKYHSLSSNLLICFCVVIYELKLKERDYETS